MNLFSRSSWRNSLILLGQRVYFQIRDFDRFDRRYLTRRRGSRVHHCLSPLRVSRHSRRQLQKALGFLGANEDGSLSGLRGSLRRGRSRRKVGALYPSRGVNCRILWLSRKWLSRLDAIFVALGNDRYLNATRPKAATHEWKCYQASDNQDGSGGQKTIEPWVAGTGFFHSRADSRQQRSRHHFIG